MEEQYIDFRMGEFSISGESLGDSLDAIIIGVGPFERAYFSAPYQPGKPPADLLCRASDGVISGPEPQAQSCDECPRKADRSCRGHQNLGLCLLDGTLARLRLPGKSVVNFTQYKRTLKSQGIHIGLAVTGIAQDPSSQYKCFAFRYLGKVTQEQAAEIYDTAKEVYGFTPLSDPSTAAITKKVPAVKWVSGEAAEPDTVEPEVPAVMQPRPAQAASSITHNGRAALAKARSRVRMMSIDDVKAGFGS
jgi:hypothetical protein